MTLSELERLKALALSPDVQIWTLRESVCLLASELEILMREYAKQREQLVTMQSVLKDVQFLAADPAIASLYGEIVT
jgi:hypothetical protein